VVRTGGEKQGVSIADLARLRWGTAARYATGVVTCIVELLRADHSILLYSHGSGRFSTSVTEGIVSARDKIAEASFEVARKRLTERLRAATKFNYRCGMPSQSEVAVRGFALRARGQGRSGCDCRPARHPLP
jgi:hypothetical protein